MKEYKRMPYLETNFTKKKVVKRAIEDIPLLASFIDIGSILRGEDSHGERENIDRIKLPCFCSFEWKGSRRLGVLINIGEKEDGLDDIWDTYSLIDMSSQTHRFVGNLIGEGTLEFLIKEYKINIGKAHIDFCETYY